MTLGRRSTNAGSTSLRIYIRSILIVTGCSFLNWSTCLWIFCKVWWSLVSTVPPGKDNWQWLLTWEVSSYCCLLMHIRMFLRRHSGPIACHLIVAVTGVPTKDWSAMACHPNTHPAQRPHECWTHARHFDASATAAINKCCILLRAFGVFCSFHWMDCYIVCALIASSIASSPDWPTSYCLLMPS